jgi:hypothetical protein
MLVQISKENLWVFPGSERRSSSYEPPHIGAENPTSPGNPILHRGWSIVENGLSTPAKSPKRALPTGS